MINSKAISVATVALNTTNTPIEAIGAVALRRYFHETNECECTLENSEFDDAIALIAEKMQQLTEDE